MDSSFSLINVVAAAINFFTLLGIILFLFFNRKSRSHQENKTMASSLSLLSPPSSLPYNCKHHVFPSFHGADVRNAFLSHILKEFRSKGIDLFIDNDMERSTSIGPELIEAIRGSRIAIVLLSKNYASSTWCLDELVEIIKCRDELCQRVMVLFYEVDPPDVKKQTGDFGKVFKKTCKGKTKDVIRRWKQALTEVAKIAGYHSRNWDNEAKMIEEIVTDVSNKLNNSTPSSDFDSLVGMESHIEKMEPLLQLDSDEVRMIGILGPPGIGKTTIARFIFDQHSRDFQLSVFMKDIKTKYAVPACSNDHSVKLYLQEQFMSQLIKEKDFKIPHLGIARDRLKDKKVLVVLDGVDQLVQLEAMAKETCWFGSRSRIIITTQDQKLLKASGVNHIYNVGFPSTDEALQMFCMYAFGQKYPKDGFTNLCCEVTKLVGELPLGLRVMGSYFRGMSKQDWIMALPRLMTRLDGEIESILKFCYDALCDEDKSLFLHVACFFDCELVDIVEGCLASCFSDVTYGLHVLAEKSLISMDSGVIEMHKLLVQLGREIVRKQSVSEPGKRQFLNHAKDIGEVLSDDNSASFVIGNSNVIGIDLSFSYDSKEDITCTSERAFERLFNLQFLRIDGDGINPRSLNSISRKLRLLSWMEFRMPCFPSGFNPKFLVQLDMPYSKLEKLWEEIQPLSNLKWMDLRFSASLKELPDLSTATNLCYLDLSYCSSLAKLPSSIGNAVNLKKLNLGHCLSLVELPYSIGNAINLKHLDLRYCSNLVELPFSIGNATNLQELDLSHCSNLMELPSSMRNLGKLSKLELKKCSKLEVILANINLASLRVLNISDCSLLKSYHETSTNIEDGELSGTEIKKEPSISLEHFIHPTTVNLVSEYFGNMKMLHPNVQELNPWIGRISRLCRLVLSGMKKLVSLPQLPYSIEELDADNCVSLERLDCSFLNPDIRLNFVNCFKLNQEARDLIIQTTTNRYAVLPGRKVPVCFTYRSSGGSLTVKLNQGNLRTSTKFKACIIFADKYIYGCGGVGEREYVYCRITSKQNTHNACISGWITLQPLISKHLYTFDVEAVKLTSTELVFEFILFNKTGGMIKECGIFQILEVPFIKANTPAASESLQNGKVLESKACNKLNDSVIKGSLQMNHLGQECKKSNDSNTDSRVPRLQHFPATKQNSSDMITALVTGSGHVRLLTRLIQGHVDDTSG